ncbi:hypothetical protein [Sporosarcina sp. G11-34]|uniref:hypothetical protein n=1 Tax=Sporosarcina sp. G11-34 TaxID=2849605 RepID=UPI0022A9E750|nr:hypothetical protein [Sporosarcina sp. G11-34]
MSACLIGFGQGVLFPLLILKALDRAGPYQGDRAVAITSSCIFIGQFLSPIVLDGIGGISSNPSIRFQYGVLAIFILITVTITMIILLKHSHQLSNRISGTT